MGGTSWSDSAYDDINSMKARTGKATFGHTAAINTGSVAPSTHKSLDPKSFKAGVREARDSDDHPESNPIYIGLDVTGSMGQVPITMQTKLKDLMGYLLRKQYITDPAICISGIGDYEAGDKAPFQCGQFESGVEIDNDLTNLYIEGNGGGNNQESYHLGLYFLARCVKTDAFEKRGKKGYAFIICDESLADTCKGSSIQAVFGTPSENISTKDLVAEVLEKWELYCIVPNMTSHYKTALQNSWKNVLGERVIFLDDPSTIVECIAGCIGMIEDNVNDLTTDLIDSGLKIDQARSVTTALSKVKGTGMSKLKNTGLATL